MSKLTINGRGIYVRQICLDADAADEIVETGELPDDFYVDPGEYGEVNTLCSGFFYDSTVFLDGENIGTVNDIVNKARKLNNSAKNVSQYSYDVYIKKIIKEAGSASFVIETRSTSGVQANFEIPDYVLDDKRNVSDQFVLDFANSLEEDVAGVYFVAKWAGNPIVDGIDCEESDGEFRFIYKGKEIEI